MQKKINILSIIGLSLLLTSCKHISLEPITEVKDNMIYNKEIDAYIKMDTKDEKRDTALENMIKENAGMKATANKPEQFRFDIPYEQTSFYVPEGSAKTINLYGETWEVYQENNSDGVVSSYMIIHQIDNSEKNKKQINKDINDLTKKIISDNKNILYSKNTTIDFTRNQDRSKKYLKMINEDTENEIKEKERIDKILETSNPDEVEALVDKEMEKIKKEKKKNTEVIDYNYLEKEMEKNQAFLLFEGSDFYLAYTLTNDILDEIVDVRIAYISKNNYHNRGSFKDTILKDVKEGLEKTKGKDLLKYTYYDPDGKVIRYTKDLEDTNKEDQLKYILNAPSSNIEEPLREDQKTGDQIYEERQEKYKKLETKRENINN